MWATKLDMSKDECRGELRRMELDAYSSVVSTFRAQGGLDSNKHGLLEQLRRLFNISDDRHKGEIRRVANCEKLTTISELMTGKNFELEWIKEGHRNYPLIARSPPFTALQILADYASRRASLENIILPHPYDTRRTKTLDDEIDSNPIITKDPTLPPPSNPLLSINRKDMKRSYFDPATPHSARKKQQSGQLYQHLKNNIASPNMKIKQLYNTFQAKRSRKTLAKKPTNKVRTKGGSSNSNSKGLSSPHMIHSYASPVDEKLFEGPELQRHLTSQLMPPPQTPSSSTSSSSLSSATTTTTSSISPATSSVAVFYNRGLQPQSQSSFAPILPTSKKDVASNLIKMNYQNFTPNEPQAHYIPTNTSNRKSKSSAQLIQQQNQQQNQQQLGNILQNTLKSPSNAKSGYQQKFAQSNGAENIPDPKIIFTNSSSKPATINNTQPIKIEPKILPQLDTQPPQIPQSPLQQSVTNENNHDIPATPSPLQLLSTAANLAPKLKVTPIPVQFKTVPNRIKIIPSGAGLSKVLQFNNNQIQFKGQPTVLSQAQAGKFKVQKIQLVMNHKGINEMQQQPGTSNNTSLPITTTVTTTTTTASTKITGKAGQVMLSGKSFVSNHVLKPIGIASGKNVVTGPKLIVQSVDRKFMAMPNIEIIEPPKKYNIVDNQLVSVVNVHSKTVMQDITGASPVKVSTTMNMAHLAKMIPANKIKLKLGPHFGNSTAKVLATSAATVPKDTANQTQRVKVKILPNSQLNNSQQSSVITTTAPTPINVRDSEVTEDWEQKLDDVMRKMGSKTTSKSSDSETVAKKIRLSKEDIEKGTTEIISKTVVIVENEPAIIEATQLLGEVVIETNNDNFEDTANVGVYDDTNNNPIQTGDISDETEYLNQDSSDDQQVKTDDDMKMGEEEHLNFESADEIIVNGNVDDFKPRSTNGAEAYESLVKSLEDDESEFLHESESDS